MSKILDKLEIKHILKYPNKPTLVFLHDSLGSIELWRDFPEKLAEITQCNLLVYDRLGYGKSTAMETPIRETNYLELEADILNQILDNLQINNAILFGHSDGGSIAIITASKYPKKIKAVIVEAAHIFVEDITLKGIQNAIEAYTNTNLEQRLYKYHGNKTENIFKAWTDIWTSTKFADWNIEYMLPDIISPLLFIQGENDEYGTLKQLNSTINQVSGIADKYIIPNIGHTPHKEAPDVVLKKVSTFINSLNN